MSLISRELAKFLIISHESWIGRGGGRSHPLQKRQRSGRGNPVESTGLQKPEMGHPHGRGRGSPFRGSVTIANVNVGKSYRLEKVMSLILGELGIFLIISAEHWIREVARHSHPLQKPQRMGHPHGRGRGLPFGASVQIADESVGESYRLRANGPGSAVRFAAMSATISQPPICAAEALSHGCKEIGGRGDGFAPD